MVVPLLLVLVSMSMEPVGQWYFSHMMDEMWSGDDQQHEQREERPEGTQAHA